MANEKDLLEELFQSVDIIVNAKLNNLQYDITELCTIEEVKGNKEYYVSNGSAKYIAYAQGDAVYTKGVSVYVIIPQGNYDNQKLIVGQYTSKDSSTERWVSPMEDFVNITGNIVGNMGKIGLMANGETYYYDKKPIWTSDKTYTQYDRLCISADFSTDFIAMKDLVIDGSYGLILTGTKTSPIEKEGEDNLVQEFKDSNFICVFDSADMTGNPYDFTAPFNQQKMFVLNKADKISNLSLYFYQGLKEDYTFGKTFYDINDNLIESEQNNLFVENISVNFGYNFDEYSDETAVLYTLDSTIYKKDEVPQGEKPQRSMRLRWVHFDDSGQPHSITDIGHDSLKDHFVEVHWYRYYLQSEIFEDPLAGYFWKEIEGSKDKFELIADLETNWKEENFKVIIRYDDKIIESKILEFTNLDGQIADKSMVQGLNILFPDDDEYKGKFYIYGDDHNANISTEKTMSLIADYITVESQTEYWESTDVICWKFPAYQTMIHKPEQDFEFFAADGDVFLEAESGQSALVNGITFTASPEYHQVIRRINIVKNEDGTNNTLDSRKQNYRVNAQYIGTATNNTIKCEVFKPSVNSVKAEISFTFGLYSTNGTKYTLVIDWVENATDGVFQRPPAITAGITRTWTFEAHILDAAQKEIKAPDGGWPLTLSWYENRRYGTTSTIDSIFSLNSGNRTLTVPTNSSYINNAWYQVLQIQVGGFEYALTTRIPIPVRSARYITGMEGPDRIYYDAAGYNPKYNNKFYQLLFRPGDYLKPVATWGIENTGVNNVLSQLPRLEVRSDEKTYLWAPDTFLPPEGGKYDGVGVVAKNGNSVLWAQPLYITMDAYGSQFFNDWDGSMVIDKDSNTILTSVIGAGKKDAENRYYGVVLGEVNKTTVVNSNESSTTGILGFHQGVQSFGLLDNGTAFLGKSGSGQIKFDGNSGTIESGNYEQNTAGMQIDLNNGMINANNFQLNSSKVWIDSTGGNGYYLKVADSKDASNSYFQVGTGTVSMGKWNLDNNGQFVGLNSSKYTLVAPPGVNTGNWVFAAGASSNSDWTTAPFRVDQDGNLVANNATISGSVNITGGSIDIGDNFNVDNNGNLSASNVNLSGTINATSGIIGGCTIENGVLKVGNANIDSLDLGKLTLDGSSVNWTTAYFVTDVEVFASQGDFAHFVRDINSWSFTEGVSFTKRNIYLPGQLFTRVYRARCSVLGYVAQSYYENETASTGASFGYDYSDSISISTS